MCSYRHYRQIEATSRFASSASTRCLCSARISSPASKSVEERACRKRAGGADLAAPSSMIDPCDDVGEGGTKITTECQGARSRLVHAYRVILLSGEGVHYFRVWLVCLSAHLNSGSNSPHRREIDRRPPRCCTSTEEAEELGAVRPQACRLRLTNERAPKSHTSGLRASNTWCAAACRSCSLPSTRRDSIISPLCPVHTHPRRPHTLPIA